MVSIYRYKWDNHKKTFHKELAFRADIQEWFQLKQDYQSFTKKHGNYRCITSYVLSFINYRCTMKYNTCNVMMYQSYVPLYSRFILTDMIKKFKCTNYCLWSQSWIVVKFCLHIRIYMFGKPRPSTSYTLLHKTIDASKEFPNTVNNS